MFVCSLPKEDFQIGDPIEVLDQMGTDLCQDMVAVSIAEDYFGIKFDPLYTRARVRELFDVGVGPIDLDMIIDTCCIYGFLPEEDAPFSLEVTPVEIATDPKKWDRRLDKIAKQYRPIKGERIWGFRNNFNLVRAGMSKGGLSVGFGTYWQQEWNKEKDGIIKSNYQNYKLFPHALKAFGQETIDGIIYLKVLNSRGKSIGNQGVFYFSEKQIISSPYTFRFD